MANLLPLEVLKAYWSTGEVTINLVIFLNLLGALLLGLLVGYERSYHGRAAGMRTYGLVCMASTALTVVVGYPEHWYGGLVHTLVGADPTRVIQGVVTGVGFLGAGVIMKEGFNISGLTTAASIWAASAIGVLVGVGFYAAGILLAVLSAASMMWMSRLENWLPSRQAISVLFGFSKTQAPDEARLTSELRSRGYEIAWGSAQVIYQQEKLEWRFVAVALGKGQGMPLACLAKELAQLEGLESLHLTPARN